MIVGLVGLGVLTFGLAKGVSAYERHVLTEHLEAEISQSAGSAIDCYNTYIASEDAYYTQALAEELHHLAKLILFPLVLYRKQYLCLETVAYQLKIF